MTVEDYIRSLRDYPGFIPGLLVTAAAALLLGTAVGRRVGAGRTLGSALILSVGLIAAATLTPGADPPRGGLGCDWSRIGPATLGQMVALGTVTLNILLFMPLGVVVGALGRSRAKALILIGAAAFPIAIESFQRLVPSLDRACQTADVFDNLMGLGLGLVAGSIAGWLVGRWTRHGGAVLDRDAFRTTEPRPEPPR